MDQLDKKLLSLLQSEGRISNFDLSQKIGLSASPCLRRMRQLEKAGVILSYRAELDRQKIGLGLTIFAMIKTERHSQEEADLLEVEFERIPQIINCHVLSGASFDFLLEIVVPDMPAYERLLFGKLLKLPYIKDISTSFSLRRMKNTALPLDHIKV